MLLKAISKLNHNVMDSLEETEQVIDALSSRGQHALSGTLIM
jgi:hypothetical protein